MTFLIIAGERYVLQIGETTLGGHDDELLRDSLLGTLPPFAVITVGGEATTIRALSGSDPVVVSGAPLGAGERPLRHGDRIVACGATLHVGDVGKAGRTEHVSGVTDADLQARASLAAADPTASTGGRLERLSDGCTFPLPDDGLTIGRDPDCGVVLASRQASRRHARIAAGLLGYSVVDESPNGVLLNGARVQGSSLLSQGDVIEIGDERFRFTADLASYEPDAALFAAEMVPLRAAEPAAARSPRGASEAMAAGASPASPVAPPQPAPVLATLEVLSGSLPAGTIFRVERPVVQLGRAAQSDVRLVDDSVSGTHATLIQRGGAWQVLDLASRNGTYVEGRRVSECTLQGVCEIRFGAVTLLFRPLRSAAPDHIGTLGVFGLGDAELPRRH